MAANNVNNAPAISSVVRYARASLCILGVSVTVLLFNALAVGQDPPPDLMKRVAARETENEAARNEYMYRQTVVVSDFVGQFREVREVIFSPTGVRTEEVVEK